MPSVGMHGVIQQIGATDGRMRTYLHLANAQTRLLYG
jgi:hypothetical protein